MSVPDEKLVPAKGPGKYIRIRVQDGESTNVSVNLPLSLAKIAAKFIPKDASMKLNEQNIDIKELLEALEVDASKENLVDVVDGDTKVQIYID